jgi:hypothetical protein
MFLIKDGFVGVNGALWEYSVMVHNKMKSYPLFILKFID